MTIEKALTQLNSLMKDRESHVHRDDFDEVFLQDIEALKVAIQVLENQPKEKTGKWTIIREVLIPPNWRAELKFECKCSECGYVQVIPFGTKFCYHCGQALDWSDEDDNE